MDLLEPLGASWSVLGTVLISTVAVYVAVIVLTRLSGVRSLAKMSSFDFAATVAVGSTVAATSLATTTLSNGLLVLSLLYGLQYLVASLRRRDLLRGLTDNAPILLVAGDRVIEDNLRHARVSREELYSKLRMAGVHRLDQVRAVVMETTGDMSVLRADEPVDDALLAGIRGAEALR
jgi:uncharacterized membrane protein YcaP (DUF421 family)